MKTCAKCKTEKDESQFNKRKNGSKDGLQSYCSECQKATCKEEPKTRRNKTELSGRYAIYGITTNDYDRMYAAQDGKCFICGTYHEVLDVDHDHKSGQVRALLCGRCNRGLGMFKDNPSILRRAATYLTDVIISRQSEALKSKVL